MGTATTTTTDREAFATTSPLRSLGADAYTVSSNFEVHVYVVAAFAEGVYEIDIHHSVYETGGGYTWTKMPGVVFEPNDVTISRLDGDPNNISEYAGRNSEPSLALGFPRLPGVL